MKKNHVLINGKEIEVKSASRRYLVNRTGAFFRVLESYPLPTILSIRKKTDGTQFDGYEYLFYWVVAAFEDYEFAKKHFWDIEVRTLRKIMEIYIKRLGDPTRKDEKPKRRRKAVKEEPLRKDFEAWLEIEEKISRAPTMDKVWELLDGWTIREVQEMVELSNWTGRKGGEHERMLVQFADILTIRVA